MIHQKKQKCHTVRLSTTNLHPKTSPADGDPSAFQPRHNRFVHPHIQQEQQKAKSCSSSEKVSGTWHFSGENTPTTTTSFPNGPKMIQPWEISKKRRRSHGVKHPKQKCHTAGDIESFGTRRPEKYTPGRWGSTSLQASTQPVCTPTSKQNQKRDLATASKCRC